MSFWLKLIIFFYIDLDNINIVNNINPSNEAEDYQHNVFAMSITHSHVCKMFTALLHLGNFYKVNTGHKDLSELRPPTGNHGLESPKSYVAIQTLKGGRRRHLNNDLTLLPSY